MSKTCLLSPGIPDTTPESKSHAENLNSGRDGMGAGPGGAKCAGARRGSRGSTAATGGAGEALCRRLTG